jgi:hypothetical protein
LYRRLSGPQRWKLEERQEEEDEKFIGSVFGVGSSKRKIISEEIIENVEDMRESSAPDRANKIARLSYGVNTKADNQEMLKPSDTSQSKSMGLEEKYFTSAGIEPRLSSL